METPRIRAAIEYVIDGDLRFLSHHDEIRLMTRALVRAAWSIAYSSGFNPQPRLSLPLPRRLGTASLSQWAIVDLAEARVACELFDAISRAAPGKLPISGVTSPLPPGTPHPMRVECDVELDSADLDIAGNLENLLSAETLIVERGSGPGKPVRPLDIRPYIQAIVLDGATLRMTLTYDGQRTARPTEILKAIGLTESAYAHRIRQTCITWNMELAGRDRWPAAPERTTLGQEEDHARRRRFQAAHA